MCLQRCLEGRAPVCIPVGLLSVSEASHAASILVAHIVTGKYQGTGCTSGLCPSSLITWESCMEKIVHIHDQNMLLAMFPCKESSTLPCVWTSGACFIVPASGRSYCTSCIMLGWAVCNVSQAWALKVLSLFSIGVKIILRLHWVCCTVPLGLLWVCAAFWVNSSSARVCT